MAQPAANNAAAANKAPIPSLMVFIYFVFLLTGLVVRPKPGKWRRLDSESGRERRARDGGIEGYTTRCREHDPVMNGSGRAAERTMGSGDWLVVGRVIWPASTRYYPREGGTVTNWNLISQPGQVSPADLRIWNLWRRPTRSTNTPRPPTLTRLDQQGAVLQEERHGGGVGRMGENCGRRVGGFQLGQHP